MCISYIITELSSSRWVKNSIRNATFQPKAALSVSHGARLLLLSQLSGSSSISQFGCIPRKTVGWKVLDTARPAALQMETIPTWDLQKFAIFSQSQTSLQRYKHVPWHELPKHDQL